MSDYIPPIGAPDPRALAYLRRAWRLIPPSAVMRRTGLPAVPLRQWLTQNAEAIRVQAHVREAAVRAVEEATGTTMQEVEG